MQRLAAALSDRYRIERELGAGGMATVYLADDVKHRRKVAIKVLRPELAAALGTERFLREIETTASLRHPHILPLYDSGEAGGFLFYVMPNVEGESLRDRLNRERQLPIDEALTIVREVADALGHAHSRGVVHRDIKPENILFEGGHAVVADFGIARAVSAAGADRLTETGLSIGTPDYMSPEQSAGSLQSGVRVVRAAGRDAAVHGTERPGGGGTAHDRPGTQHPDRAPDRAGLSGTHRHEGDGEGPGRPLRDGRTVRGGAAAARGWNG
jgi:serine/threonine-protein kinase